MGYRVFPDVNIIGRPKAVASIPILLGNYRQLQYKNANVSPVWQLPKFFEADVLVPINIRLLDHLNQFSVSEIYTKSEKKPYF